MFHRDQWLSEVLGMSCFGAGRVPEHVSASDLNSAMAAAAPKGRAFFASKQTTEDVAAVEAFVRAGFNVVDVGVTLTHDGELAETREIGGVRIDDADKAIEEELTGLAGRCFSYSRFHADYRVGAKLADNVKSQWARNACRGRAAAVYVARRAGEVAGFLAVLKRDSDAGSEAVIDLIGVDPEHQGKGIGRALSLHFIREWQGQVGRLRVGTQAANIPALRLYESLGFRVAETAYALHAHLMDGEAMT